MFGFGVFSWGHFTFFIICVLFFGKVALFFRSFVCQFLALFDFVRYLIEGPELGLALSFVRSYGFGCLLGYFIERLW